MGEKLGALIGIGNTADVFDFGPGKVAKLFHAGYPLASVRKEFENSRLLNSLDVLTPKSHELFQLEDRIAIVYDKISGVSLLDLIQQTRDVNQYAVVLADIHKKILKTHLPSADPAKMILKRNIEHTAVLTEQQKNKLFEILKVLPEDQCFCHGDFHFGNILYAEGQYYLIDFMNICQGHPYYDIARTVYLIEFTPVPAEIPDPNTFLQLKKQAAAIYLQTMAISRVNLTPWLTVIAAARLAELRKSQIQEKDTALQYLSANGI